MLILDQVHVSRGRSTILHDISLQLPAGKMLAVVGESGAGKSSLIATILGVLHPAEGTVTWGGHPIRTIRPALVMQEPRSAFNPALTLTRP